MSAPVLPSILHRQAAVRPPKASAADLEVVAVRSLVQILCDGRLAAVVAILLRALLDGTGGGALLVVLALPLSWLPLRYWSRRPDLFHRSRGFAVADAAVTVIVIALCVATSGTWELGVVYLCFSAGLAGALSRRGSAVLATSVMAAITSLLLQIAGVAFVWNVFIVLCAVGTAYGTSSLAGQLRHQGLLARKVIVARAVEAAQEERAHLAREMHDSLAKTLHGVELMAGAIAEDLAADRSPHAPLAHRAHEACAVATVEARRVLAGLRSTPEQHPVQAVRLDAARWSAYSGIPVTCHIDEGLESRDIDPETGYHLLKVFGELLENVARHARATSVEVTVAADGAGLVLDVVDDGVGMAGTADEELALGGHFGVLGMRERLRLIGGSLDYRLGAHGSGTRARVRVEPSPSVEGVRR